MTDVFRAGVRPAGRSRLDRLPLAAAAAGAGVLAGAVRVHGALHYAFWQDEVASARIVATRGPIHMLRHVVGTESTPPGWYAAAWLAHRAGLAVVDVRLLSVAAGTALAAVVVVYARRFAPLWAAALAGLAMALGYQYVFHGRELRAYEMFALLAALLAVAVQRAVEQPTRGRLAVAALVVAAGSLTHYFFALSVATALLWLAASRAPAAARRATARACALGLAPLVAWTPMLVRQVEHDRFSFIGSFRPRDVLTAYWMLFARAQPRGAVVHTVAPLILLAAVLAGAVVLARTSDAGLLCGLLAVGPPLIAAALWLGGLHIFDVRNLVGVGPFAAVAVAALLARASRPVAVAGACLCAALLAVGFVRADHVPPVAYDRVAAALVAEGWRAGDSIVVVGDPYALWGPLEWYLPGRPRLVLAAARAPLPAPHYVVARRGPAWGPLRREAASLRVVRGILVARVDTPVPRPGSHVLAVHGSGR